MLLIFGMDLVSIYFWSIILVATVFGLLALYAFCEEWWHMWVIMATLWSPLIYKIYTTGLNFIPPAYPF